MAQAARRSAAIHVIGQQSPASGIDVLGDDDEPAATTLVVGEDGSITLEIGGDNEDKPGQDNSFDANLAKRLDPGALGALAEYLLEGIRADIASRKDWEETANLGAKYLGVTLEEPGEPSADGTISKVISAAILKANVKMWATARAELLPVGGPVKVKRDDLPNGEDGGDGATDELANALEQDMNWYLTVGDREYYPDTSKMLRHRALIGNGFKKVYRCPLLRKPVSRWVKAQNLVISNDCTHISGAGRVTEIIRLRQSVMRRLQAQGHYLDTALVQPTGETTDTEEATAEGEGIAAAPERPQDFEHLVYECQCELDSYALPGLEPLDRDEAGRKPGFPLPYRVSIDVDRRAVLEVRRDWKQGDSDYWRRRRYVKYGMIPGEGFYDWGLIHIAGNPTMAATMIERSAVDSALLNNFPGGMRLRTAAGRTIKTVVRPSPGEWVDIDGGGNDDIRKVMLPNPYKPPSPESMALAQALEKEVADLAGVIDLPVGEGRIGNTPVGTMMSYVEVVSQVPGAVHKDDHAAQAEEFELLRELLAAEPEILWRGNKTPKRKWRVAEELLSPDLVPAADPNTPSAVHRLMKLQALVQLGGLPQFAGIADNRAIYSHAMTLLGSGDPQDFMAPPQLAAAPPPDPRIVAAQIKAQSQQASDQAKLQSVAAQHQERMAELQQEGAQRDADRQSDETRAAMSLEAARLKTAHDTANAAADRAHEAGLAALDQHQATADRASQQGIAGAQLVQRHVQHLNELGAQQQAAQAQEPEES